MTSETTSIPPRLLAVRKKAALEAARRLQAAADALDAFSLACLDCDDASAPRRADDGRTLLSRSMREFSGHLDSVFNK
jgi:hypothetical protein